MSWIWIGVMIGIGLMLAPLVLMLGVLLIIFFGLTALGAVAGFFIVGSTGSDPLVGALFGGGAGLLLTILIVAIRSDSR